MTQTSRLEELDRVFRQTVLLYWRLTADAAQIHGRGEVSGPRRTILIALSEGGPQTVARLARARAQARQRIQPLVNALIAEGLAAALPNPMHKQSSLITLTAAGEKQVRQMRKREGALLNRLPLKVSSGRLRAAADVLRDIRETLERELPRLLKR